MKSCICKLIRKLADKPVSSAEEVQKRSSRHLFHQWRRDWRFIGHDGPDCLRPPTLQEINTTVQQHEIKYQSVNRKLTPTVGKLHAQFWSTSPATRHECPLSYSCTSMRACAGKVPCHKYVLALVSISLSQ